LQKIEYTRRPDERRENCEADGYSNINADSNRLTDAAKHTAPVVKTISGKLRARAGPGIWSMNSYGNEKAVKDSKSHGMKKSTGTVS
jgi:hypothetical protein